MNQRIAVPLLIILGFFLVESPVRAEVIDRIAAVVNGRIITLSDIRKENEVRAVVERGYKPQTEAVLLQSMIDNDLLDEEMAQYPGLDVNDDEIDEQMKSISNFRGVAPAEIRDALSREIQRYKYISLRYRQFIVISNEEIKNFYDSTFVPEVRKTGDTVPDLQDVTDKIRTILFEEKVIDELEASLKAIRARSNTIEVF